VDNSLESVFFCVQNVHNRTILHFVEILRNQTIKQFGDKLLINLEIFRSVTFETFSNFFFCAQNAHSSIFKKISYVRYSYISLKLSNSSTPDYYYIFGVNYMNAFSKYIFLGVETVQTVVI
jgi:hypothetical protein